MWVCDTWATGGRRASETGCCHLFRSWSTSHLSPLSPVFERMGSFRYSKAPDRWEWPDASSHRTVGRRSGLIRPLVLG
jgi:hypothetical protein